MDQQPDPSTSLAEFFRREAAPVYRLEGATAVVEELRRRGMHEAAGVALQVACQQLQRSS